MSHTWQDIVAELVGRPYYKRFARQFVNPQDVEEAIQRTAIICLKRAPLTMREAERYFTTVLRNECLGILKREKRQAHFSIGGGSTYRSLEPDDPRQDPAAVCEHRSEMALVAHLKPAERQALSDLAAGLSYNEISEKHGWTWTKVNRCLSEGRARLRELGAVA